MARSPSGVYTLPAGNPVASGTIIQAAWANTTMNDIATALTDSLDREGRGGMNAPLKFADGAAATPGITWINEPTTGWYRAAAGDIRASVLGSDLFRLQGGQAQLWANATWNNLLYQIPPENTPSGTAAWQTLTWNNGTSAWNATSKFTVNDTTGAVIVTGGASATVTAVGFIGALTGNATTATTATTANGLNRSVIAGAGMTGGGVLTADQTLNVIAGTGITVAADSVGLDTCQARRTPITPLSL